MHICELHIRHVNVAVQGRTTAPSRSIYITLQTIWPDIVDKINSEDAVLKKLNWSKPEFCPGTLLHKLLKETLEFCNTALAMSTFERGDHKYLCQLVVVFLGGHIEKFRFKQPGAHHQARWFADCIYLLVIRMTERYTDFSQEISEKVEIMTE